MPQIASTLGSIASSPTTAGLLDIAQLGSTGYNLYNQYKNQQYQNYLRDLAQNPAKMNALAQQYTQPLNAGLTTGVANQAQAYLASRGLSDSPQISQQVEAQAIAPYIQQNQQEGYQNALAALGLGGGAINPALQQQNGLSALTKAFSQLGNGGTLNPAIIQSLLKSGAVQPNTLDLGSLNPSALDLGTRPFTPIDTSSWGATPDWSTFQTTPPTVSYEPDYLAAAGAY